MGPQPLRVEDLAGLKGRFRRVLETVDRVLVFGSLARGTSGPDSDVDILVVSEAFRGLSYVRRAVRARKAWQLPHAVDFLCYAPEEFERFRGQVSIVRLALEEGQEIET